MIQSHHLPTCDDVFDVLTRGPFPTGQHEIDFPVQRHLTVCHSCRELAEALRPVTAVLAEGQQDVPDEATTLPVFLAEAQAPCSCCVADQAEPKRTDPVRELRLPLIALALSLMVVLALSGSWLSARQTPSQGPALPVGTLIADSPAGHSGMGEAGFSLTGCSLLAVDKLQQPATGEVDHANHQLTQQFSAEHCCSQCHHAGKSSQPAASKTFALKGPQMLALVSRCSLCHAK
ncbi:hypothetical protein [Blastopirellula marina]|uniref:Uncharacterized protein n=1 Tax=Blastopirellula marina TaxID=124 RepID=A0A2S8FHW1_9BACT|nr:hypothetical protein [Blastopirellula marina]PQO31759.1 hypothetical protein C5Y98_20315 [Blastopirellula marina]PTL43066.1 hypothetical protein C5Y97_20325 [Blastopirellula marina]